MRKLIVSLIALAFAVLPVNAQWKVNDTVAPAGQDANKAQSVQGIAGGKDIPVSIGSPVTLAQPVTVVTSGGVTIITEATGLAIKAVLEGIGASAQQVQGTTPIGDVFLGNPNVIGGRDSATRARALALSTSGQVILIDSTTPTDNKANVHGELKNGSGNDRPLAIFPYVWDAEGTNWDRKPGDTRGSFTLEKLDGTEWNYQANFAAAQTDTVVMACPAGKRIVLAYAFITTNATNDFTFQDEDDALVSPTIYCNGSGSGAVAPPGGRAILWIGATDKDLEVDTTQAVNHGVWASGYIID